MAQSIIELITTTLHTRKICPPILRKGKNQINLQTNKKKKTKQTSPYSRVQARHVMTKVSSKCPEGI